MGSNKKPALYGAGVYSPLRIVSYSENCVKENIENFASSLGIA